MGTPRPLGPATLLPARPGLSAPPTRPPGGCPPTWPRPPRTPQGAAPPPQRGPAASPQLLRGGGCATSLEILAAEERASISKPKAVAAADLRGPFIRAPALPQPRVGRPRDSAASSRVRPPDGCSPVTGPGGGEPARGEHLPGHVLIEILSTHKKLNESLDENFKKFPKEITHELEKKMELDGKHMNYIETITSRQSEIQKFIADDCKEALLEEKRHFCFLVDKHCSFANNLHYYHLQNYSIPGFPGGRKPVVMLPKCPRRS
ncbi:basic proline-rich protein-like [Mustela erminea]|uniref:basic proline-rich protein-like n=1 Tax=Mustela erminea TaxID=36723 RepID=UPI0013870D0B|nr:basic proline-rich protein-like [Mustela erminea]